MPKSPLPTVPAAARRRMLAAARRYRAAAYAPYSEFRVGAAVLAPDGRVFGGCNVENASSASALCAEQSAVVAAVAAGARRLRAVLVLTGAKEPTAPCGRCRQVLAEFGAAAGGGMAVLMSTTGGKSRESTLVELLPHPFRR